MDKLQLLNSLKITESDGDGESLYYANVSNTPENVEVLREIGVPQKEIDDMTSNDGGDIDISEFAWQYTSEKYYHGDFGWLDHVLIREE